MRAEVQISCELPHLRINTFLSALCGSDGRSTHIVKYDFCRNTADLFEGFDKAPKHIILFLEPAVINRIESGIAKFQVEYIECDWISGTGVKCNVFFPVHLCLISFFGFESRESFRLFLWKKFLVLYIFRKVTVSADDFLTILIRNS